MKLEEQHLVELGVHAAVDMQAFKRIQKSLDNVVQDDDAFMRVPIPPEIGWLENHPLSWKPGLG